MTKLRPFRGWHYNPEKFSHMNDVVAPPYDVIDEKKLKSLLAASPYNVVRADLPSAFPSDGDVYENAGKLFREWQDSGVLTQDDELSLYLYFQTYQLPNGEAITRRGFFVRRRLESFAEGGVKPHEKTFAGPKADRLNLMQATSANLSPIFGLFSDPENSVGSQWESVTQAAPLFEFSGDDHQEHRLWRLSDPQKISDLLAEIQNQAILIADGHHRYETALNYRELKKAELGADYTGEEDFNFVMMFCCSLQEPGLKVLPTHRVVTERPSIAPDLINDLLAKYGEVKKFPITELKSAMNFLEAEGRADHAIAWVHDKVIEVYTFDREKLLASESLNHLHYAVRDLDVTLLHHLILEEILGVSQGAQREYGTLKYIKDAQEVVDVVVNKQTYGFLLNATKIEQMEAVTEIGATMPQKSTFFYPKIPTGLVFYGFSN